MSARNQINAAEKALGVSRSGHDVILKEPSVTVTWKSHGPSWEIANCSSYEQAIQMLMAAALDIMQAAIKLAAGKVQPVSPMELPPGVDLRRPV